MSLLRIIFFSSRRRHTRWTGDWSSDVCSSDLPQGNGYRSKSARHHQCNAARNCGNDKIQDNLVTLYTRFFLALLAIPLAAQNISTIAGGGPRNLTATALGIANPAGVAVDSSGN